jgi:hypothetical protein
MKYSDLLAAIEPIVRGWIEQMIGARKGSTDFGDLELGKVIRIRSTTVDMFDGDDNGFETANTGASSGDVILLPPKTFTSTLTITAGVKIVGWSRYSTTLSGEITGTAGSSIENLTVSRTANSAATLKGVVGPATGTFYIHNCDVKADQSGSGDARGISAETNSTTVEAWNSYIYGNSGSGTGNGTWRDTGTTAIIIIFGGRVYGSTNPCNE